MYLTIRTSATETAAGKLLAILLYVAMLFCSVSSSVLAGEMDDSDITWAVWNALEDIQDVKTHHINVCADDGVVELSGRVNSFVAKERAGEIARSIKGVRSVENRITVLHGVDPSGKKAYEESKKANRKKGMIHDVRNPDRR